MWHPVVFPPKSHRQKRVLFLGVGPHVKWRWGRPSAEPRSREESGPAWAEAEGWDAKGLESPPKTLNGGPWGKGWPVKIYAGKRSRWSLRAYKRKDPREPSSETVQPAMNADSTPQRSRRVWGLLTRTPRLTASGGAGAGISPR